MFSANVQFGKLMTSNFLEQSRQLRKKRDHQLSALSQSSVSVRLKQNFSREETARSLSNLRQPNLPKEEAEELSSTGLSGVASKTLRSSSALLRAIQEEVGNSKGAPSEESLKEYAGQIQALEEEFNKQGLQNDAFVSAAKASIKIAHENLLQVAQGEEITTTKTSVETVDQVALSQTLSTLSGELENHAVALTKGISALEVPQSNQEKMVEMEKVLGEQVGIFSQALQTGEFSGQSHTVLNRMRNFLSYIQSDLKTHIGRGNFSDSAVKSAYNNLSFAQKRADVYGAQRGVSADAQDLMKSLSPELKTLLGKVDGSLKVDTSSYEEVGKAIGKLTKNLQEVPGNKKYDSLALKSYSQLKEISEKVGQLKSEKGIEEPLSQLKKSVESALKSLSSHIETIENPRTITETVTVKADTSLAQTRASMHLKAASGILEGRSVRPTVTIEESTEKLAKKIRVTPKSTYLHQKRYLAQSLFEKLEEMKEVDSKEKEGR